jgi:hypothetical protein
MYKAEQDQLKQVTNQGLINIRNQEINYHVNVYLALGTQAAMICGFCYASFLRDFASGRWWSYHSQTCYYIVSAVTVSCAILVVTLTMAIHVLAPGLALDGPVGSMARSVDGMKAEQGAVFGIFSLMMGSFFITTVLGALTVMNDAGALGSCGVFLISAALCYKYCLRIYRRFYWDKSETMDWEDPVSVAPDGRRSSATVEDKDLQTTTVSMNPLRAIIEDPVALEEANKKRAERSKAYIASNPSKVSPVSINEVPSERPSDAARPSNLSNARPSLFARPSLMFGRGSVGAPPTVLELRSSISAGERRLNQGDVAMEGYLTKRIKSKIEFLKDPWERKYFVLNFRGDGI